MTRFWHRRICEAALLIGTTIVILYFWTVLSPDSKNLGGVLLVTEPAMLLGAATIAASFVSYLWAPKKYILMTALVIYGLLVATTAALIVGSGGVSSPFIALWMLVAVFSALFGVYALVPMFIAVNVYLVMQYIELGGLGTTTLITFVLVGELPLIASYLIWHRQTGKESSKDRAYRDLANELSQVAGKAEVVINAIADGVIALDSQGTIQLINPAAQQIIGWGKQDALALNYKSVLQLIDHNEKELEASTDPIQQVLATNQSMRTDKLLLITNSGKKLMVSVVVSPVGQIGSGVIIVFRDITKEKSEEREQAEFISTASHEMRTPVASIEGYLGLTLNPATATIDDKARDFITKAHESAQHLGRLFQDLLDVTKAEDGRLMNTPKVTDVVTFAHDIVQGFKPKADEKGLRMLYKPIPDDTDEGGERRLSPVFYAYLDNDHLREVISNLVENAIKYTPKGDVVIDIGGDDSHIRISVADSGIGIPAEDMPHLFQKFYRVDNSDTREIGGTGLGLYLCRRLAEAMNGRIWAESEYKKGSTFFLEIPRIDHEEATKLIEEAGERQAAEDSQRVPIAPPASMVAQISQEQQLAPAQPLTPAPVAQQAVPAAAQQTTVATPAPAVYSPQPVPSVASAQPAPAPQYQQPVPVQPQIQTPNGPSLSSIEQNAAAYAQAGQQARQAQVARPQTITIPVRSDPQNK